MLAASQEPLEKSQKERKETYRINRTWISWNLQPEGTENYSISKLPEY